MRKVFLFILIFFVGICRAQQSSPDKLSENFKNPPLESRPMGLWDWTNGNVSLSQITLEMEEAKSKGMGGFDIWDVGTFVDEKKVVPAGPPFMGDKSLQAIGHAVREAERIGLRLGLISASSWNSGGTWVKPEHGAMGLFKSYLSVQGPRLFKGKLPFPKQKKNTKTLIEYGKDSIPTFYREVALLAIREGKMELGSSDIIVVESKIAKDGKVSWKVPEGKWQLLRYVCVPTGQALEVPSPNSNGRVLDHFSAEATEMHLNYFVEKLQKELGSLQNRALQYLYADSYEVNTAVWTPLLVEEFEKRMGYSMIPYLPVLDGKLVKSKSTSDRFLFDYKKLLSELIISNHYQKSTDILKKYGLQFFAEAGGPGPPVHNVPFEDLKALGSLSVPRGEFWNDKSMDKKHIEELQIVKGIASAAHLYNQKYVEAESFTSVRVWQEGPQELKPLADRAFCEGLNRIVYHTFPHTPPEAGSPGWVYNFGTLIHVNNSWWPKSKSFHEYLARTSYLLQQGNFVGDVAFYYGDKAPNFVQPKRVQATLGFGYDYDVVNSESILRFMTVKDNKVYLPHGQSYQVLVLPSERKVNLEVLKKLEQMVLSGATVIGPKPVETYGLHQFERIEAEIKTIADRLWGKVDSVNVQEQNYGKGKVVWGKSVKQVLTERKVEPDFLFTSKTDTALLDYIHRSTVKEDIYFIRNTRNASLDYELSFRGNLKNVQLWNAVDGSMKNVSASQSKNRTVIKLRFEPFESFFIIFNTDSKPESSTEKEMKMVKEKPITGSWELRFPHGWGAPAKTEFDNLKSWTASADSNIQRFSGVASYYKTLDVSEAEIKSGKKIFLDLGDVREIADVWVNGHHLGERCFIPYRYEVTGVLKPGKNNLVIEVANALNNRMVGNAHLPQKYQTSSSNILKGPTPWSTPWAQYSLLSSGLLGPVRLLMY
jgi:hypothetical protein